jgi:hypothetical protein
MTESMNTNAQNKFEIEVNVPENSSLIKCKKIKVDDYEYRVFNYDSNYLCNDDQTNGLYRSVIFSGLSDKLLCFTLQKSITLETFKNLTENTRESVTVTKIEEGTMITLFYNSDINKWEIASKNSVSCDYYYYRTEYFNSVKTQDSTFRNMFLDGLQEPRKNSKEDLDDIAFIASLDKKYCYSFVLQHPENHIVLPINRPRLVLVSVFSITGNKVSYVPLHVYSKWDCFLGSVIEFLNVVDLEWISGKKDDRVPYDRLVELWGTSSTPPDLLGVNLVNNNTGMRAVIENPRYAELKILRGNNPNIQYQYLCLLHTNKVKDFLMNFPRYRPIFNRFKTQYTKFAQDIHDSYVQYFVFKNREVPISKRYFFHIFNLHKNYYIPSCVKTDESATTPKKKIITKSVVFEYLKTLEPRILIYYLNYDIHNL